jgi:hypothetical protein
VKGSNRGEEGRERNEGERGKVGRERRGGEREGEKGGERVHDKERNKRRKEKKKKDIDEGRRGAGMRRYALNMRLYNTHTDTHTSTTHTYKHTIKNTRAHAYISVTYTVQELIGGERELEFTAK